MVDGPVKILLTSVDAIGHLNSALGFGEALLKRGNDVYFTNRRKHQQTVEKRGIKFIALEDFDDSFTEANSEVFLGFIVQFMSKMELTPMERLDTWSEADNGMITTLIDELKLLDKTLRKIIDNLKPDILIGDIIFSIPLFVQSPIPCIPLFSANPVSIFYEYGLPAGTGFSVHSDKSLWKQYHDKELALHQQIITQFDDWFHSFGLEAPNMFAFRAFAKYFGIYIYPEALDYTDLGPPPKNWIRMDFSIREADNSTFVLPESLTNRSGKLIYLSMGSLGSAHIELMKKLLNTFGKSKHRFIVSKGPRGDQLTLSENMWGDNYVNQIAILPKVDLVITHGGNNTIVETLYFGKPMIVMPLFFDQLDNAQRIDDLKLGYRVEPFRYDENDIHKMVDNLLEDIDLHERVKKISQQLRSSVSREKVTEMVEETARTKQTPKNLNLN